jgi:hypothetical protein
MKITKLLLFSVAVILFSCGKDDDPIPTSQGMVGAWTITALDYKGTTTTTAQGASVKADFTGTGKALNLTVTFKDNPKVVTNEGSYTIVLKTTIMGQTSTDEYPLEEAFTDGTWALDGKTLRITGANGTDKATIIEQTSTTLKVSVNESESETDQGITIATNLQATYTFKKK